MKQHIKSNMNTSTSWVFNPLGKDAGVKSDPKPPEEEKHSEKMARPPQVMFGAFSSSTFKSPWREVDWSKEHRDALIKSISSYKPSLDSVSEARVLLLGPVGAGKSSFISSVQSVFSGRVTNCAMVGTSTSSFTKKLQSYRIRGCGEVGDQPSALVLCDVMGLGEVEMTGLTLCDILTIINGHVPEGHKFCPAQPVRAETVGYVKKPSINGRVHCVAFVVDASKIDFYSKSISAIFKQLREHISELGVHQVALLTHVDQVCQDTAHDVTNVYKSKLLQQMMTKAGNLLGMPHSYIVPVMNYSSELDLNAHMDTLLLSAVDHILQYVELYLQKSAEPKIKPDAFL